MPNYRRVFIEGGCWFFTVNLEDRRGRLLTEHIGALREAVAKVRGKMPFEIDAWVVLPDHMHTASTLPDGDSNFPTALATDQGSFRKVAPRYRTAHRCTRGPKGARHLAAALLGACDTRRAGLRVPYRLLLVQPC